MKSRWKEIISSPREFALWVLSRKICRLIPDKIYIQLKYRAILGRWPNMNHPAYLSEKIQWLKLHDRNEQYERLVDKYAVRGYVEEKIGSDFLVPLIGVWDSPDDIDWDALPNKFVMKTVNGSHTNILCTDKSKLNIEDAVNKLRKWQKSNQTFYYGREWPYKNVKPRIIAEEFIESSTPGGLIDYKFMCFLGKVDNVMLCFDRMSGHTTFNHFDKDWNFLRYQYVDADKPANYTLPKPKHIDEMFQIAETLSAPFPFVRVDLYCENDKIFFGELTFYPQSGFDTDYTPETDLHLGAQLKIPSTEGKKNIF